MPAFVPVLTGYEWVTVTLDPEDNEILSAPPGAAIVSAFVAEDLGFPEGYKLIHDDATFSINIAASGSTARFQYLPTTGDPVTAVIICIGT